MLNHLTMHLSYINDYLTHTYTPGMSMYSYYLYLTGFEFPKNATDVDYHNISNIQRI